MALVYRAHFAFSKNPIINSKGLNTSAVYGFLNTLLELLNKETPTHIAIAFDTKAPTFRSEIFSEYKANRERQPEDIQVAIPIIKQLIKYLKIEILEKDGYEADDVIGTVSSKLSNKDNTTVFMMTPDKDFAQLVSDNVFLYKPAFMGRGVDILGVKDVLQKFNISRVDQVIDFLGLQGDSVDNIPGIRGVGPKTAQKLLFEYGSVEGILKNKEKITGSVGDKVRANADDAVLSKKLATIKKDVPIELDLEMLRIKDSDSENLVKLLDDLEFRTIKNRMVSQGIIHEKKNEQLSFFDSDIKKKEKLNVSYEIVDADHIDQFVKKILLSDELCIDTETSSLNIEEAEIAGIAFSNKEYYAYYVPTIKDRQEIINKLKPVFESKSIKLIQTFIHIVRINFFLSWKE